MAVVSDHRIALSVSDAAAALGISRPTMYTLMHRADFPVVRVGRRVLIPKAALEAWLASHCQDVELK